VDEARVGKQFEQCADTASMRRGLEDEATRVFVRQLAQKAEKTPLSTGRSHAAAGLRGRKRPGPAAGGWEADRQVWRRLAEHAQGELVLLRLVQPASMLSIGRRDGISHQKMRVIHFSLRRK